MHTFVHISYSCIIFYPTPAHLVILLKAGESVHTHTFLLNQNLNVTMFPSVLAKSIHHVLDQYNFFQFFPITVRDGACTSTSKCVLISSMSKVAGLLLFLSTSSVNHRPLRALHALVPYTLSFPFCGDILCKAFSSCCLSSGLHQNQEREMFSAVIQRSSQLQQAGAKPHSSVRAAYFRECCVTVQPD